MNVDSLRLHHAAAGAPVTSRPPRPAAKDHFLKGPVPMPWLRTVATQAAQSMAVAVFIWYLAGLKKSAEFAVPTGKVEEYGVNRYKLYRDLAALQKAGLIAVERHKGRHARVKLLDAPAATSAQGGQQ
jgi:hypothetical protein